VPAARILPNEASMSTRTILGRCVAAERGAAAIYETLARRFRDDAEFAAFWRGMARDEREHARKLEAWRTLLGHQPEGSHPSLDDFGRGIHGLEAVVAECRRRALAADTPDDALAVALALESSELDVIYTTLLQSSPIARFPDIEVTRRHELGRHHEALALEVRARSTDERNLLDAELLLTEDGIGRRTG
jgi:rubrerythrin